MQREREGRNNLFDMGDPFGIFQNFGGFGTHKSSLFGRRDPFDDPFFTRPLGSMFDSGTFGSSAPSDDAQKTNREKGVLIEELNSDDEREKEDKDVGNKEDSLLKHSSSRKEPFVEHPEDDADAERKIQNVSRMNDYNRVEGTQSQARTSSVHTCKVTYGGVDGAYYTSTRTRRTGSDGVVLEESKEADRTTGQAAHRISRGIHDKGHSVTRKLNSDGKVDMMQTLHNLNEDELAGFEHAWKGNVKSNLRGSSEGFNMHGTTGSSSGEQTRKLNRGGGWMLPSLEQAQNGGWGANIEARANPSDGRNKKVVRINID